MSKIHELKPGDYIGDMHYSGRGLSRIISIEEPFDVVYKTSFEAVDPVEFLDAQMRKFKPGDRYLNKMLMIVEEPVWERVDCQTGKYRVKAMWAYDGRVIGLMELAVLAQDPIGTRPVDVGQDRQGAQPLC